MRTPGSTLIIDALYLMRKAGHMRVPPERSRDGRRVELLGFMLSQTAAAITEHGPTELLTCVGVPEASWSGDEHGANSQERACASIMEDAGLPCVSVPEDVVCKTIGSASLAAYSERTIVISGRAGLTPLMSESGVSIPGMKDVTGGLPHRWAEFVALAGSESAGIGGVRGIGPAKALEVLGHTDDLEALLEARPSTGESKPVSVARKHREDVLRDLRKARDLTDYSPASAALADMTASSLRIDRLEPVRIGKKLSEAGVGRRHAAALARSISGASLG